MVLQQSVREQPIGAQSIGDLASACRNLVDQSERQAPGADRLIRANQTLGLEDLNGSGMLKNRQLARSIAAAGRRQLRTLLQARAGQYARQVVVIKRWLPSGQMGSTCGQHDGTKERSMPDWPCPNCAAMHERDSNAARNILAEVSPCAA